MNEDFISPNDRRDIIKAISDAGMISVYKTTTKMKGEDGKLKDYEEEFCKIADYCFDLSWTFQIPDDYRKDKLHFREPIYSVFNEQLLYLLNGAVGTSNLKVSNRERVDLTSALL